MMRNLNLVLALCLFFPAGLFAQVDTLQAVVYFDVGQSTLRADARARLDALLQRRGGADWVRVELTGRTDHDGDPAANLRLAQRRIASVQAYLIEKGGLAADVCGSQAKGEADPLADNATPAGKSINRSVRIDCQVRRQPTVTSIPSASLSDAVPLAQLLDTVKKNSIPCYDANCQADTTIVLPQGTQLIFNRCEYLRLQPCLEFEEAMSAQAALVQGLSTEDTSGAPLISCGMLRITLRPGCVEDSCFKYPIRVRTLAPDPKCMPCAGVPTLYEISRNAWQPEGSESPKIALVKVEGKMYYQYEIRCPSGWKNCDCPCRKDKPRKIRYVAPKGYVIDKAYLIMNCPMIVIRRSPKKPSRAHVVKFKIFCPNETPDYGYRIFSPEGDTLVVQRRSLSTLNARNPIRKCGGGEGRGKGRYLFIFPRHRHKVYHKYFLLPRKRGASR